MTCPKCRRGLAPIDVFCGFCGVRAIPSAPRAEALAETPPAAAAPVVEPEGLPNVEPPRLEAPAASAPPAPAAWSEEPGGTAGARPAGFWIRGGAFAVDAAILAAWMGVIWSAVMGAAMVGVLAGAGPAVLLAAMERTSDLGPTVAALFAGVLLAYLVAFVVFEGATPGKMLFRLCVLRADGARVGLASALAREGLGRLVGVATLGVGFALVACSASRRGLHDLIARTQVVRLPEEQPAEG